MAPRMADPDVVRKDRFSSASTTTWSTVADIAHPSTSQPTARMLPPRGPWPGQQSTTADRPGRPLMAPSTPPFSAGHNGEPSLARTRMQCSAGMAVVRGARSGRVLHWVARHPDCPRGLVCVLPELVMSLAACSAGHSDGSFHRPQLNPNKTGLTRNAAQPDLARPNWTVETRRLAVTS
jgi:hypothetical protein